jgi:hypothetical protein
VNALKAAHAGELSEHQQRASATWEEKEAELRRITSEMEAIKVSHEKPGFCQHSFPHYPTAYKAVTTTPQTPTLNQPCRALYQVTRGEHFASAQLETTRHAEQARGLEGELREYEQVLQPLQHHLETTFPHVYFM